MSRSDARKQVRRTVRSTCLPLKLLERANITQNEETDEIIDVAKMNAKPADGVARALEDAHRIRSRQTRLRISLANKKLKHMKLLHTKALDKHN